MNIKYDVYISTVMLLIIDISNCSFSWISVSFHGSAAFLPFWLYASHAWGRGGSEYWVLRSAVFLVRGTKRENLLGDVSWDLCFWAYQPSTIKGPTHTASWRQMLPSLSLCLVGSNKEGVMCSIHHHQCSSCRAPVSVLVGCPRASLPPGLYNLCG